MPVGAASDSCSSKRTVHWTASVAIHAMDHAVSPRLSHHSSTWASSSSVPGCQQLDCSLDQGESCTCYCSHSAGLRTATQAAQLLHTDPSNTGSAPASHSSCSVLVHACACTLQLGQQRASGDRQGNGHARPPRPHLGVCTAHQQQRIGPVHVWVMHARCLSTWRRAHAAALEDTRGAAPRPCLSGALFSGLPLAGAACEARPSTTRQPRASLHTFGGRMMHSAGRGAWMLACQLCKPSSPLCMLRCGLRRSAARWGTKQRYLGVPGPPPWPRQRTCQRTVWGLCCCSGVARAQQATWQLQHASEQRQRPCTTACVSCQPWMCLGEQEFHSMTPTAHASHASHLAARPICMAS